MKRSGSTILHRAARVLTLACFLHFSGLNNGFATVTSASVPMPAPQIAPTLILASLSFFRPAFWTENLFARSFATFRRSGRLIETASQRAVRNLFVESSLFRYCLERACLESGALSVPAGPRPDPRAEASFTLQGEAGSLAVYAGALRLADPFSCIGDGRRESWLDARREVWKNGRARSRVSMGRAVSPPGNSSPEPGRFLKTRREGSRGPKPARTMLFRSDGKDSEDHEPSRPPNPEFIQEPASSKAGFFTARSPR